jgi:hypothetical protein
MARLSDNGSRPPFGPFIGLVGTLVLLAWIALSVRPVRDLPAPLVPLPAVIPVAKTIEVIPAPPVETLAVTPQPPKPKPIEPDRAAIARAEASLDAATRLRAEAESRLADAEIALRKATIAMAQDASGGRGLAYQVKDPSARIERATNKQALARWELKKLQNEVTTLAQQPRTKAKPLLEQSAVAKPIDGKEYHFEVRRDRVAQVDIDKLTDMVKTDVRIRLRQSVRNRAVSGKVGPVGEFSMRYEMAPAIPESVSDLVNAREISYQLRGWEIVPESDNRGDTYETAWQPISPFARTIARLNPTHATITMWVYPDGFPLYRQLRDDLHARGFLVAARPLPAAMAIRGSPAGSLSAGQ